jgi:ribosomal protein S27E
MTNLRICPICNSPTNTYIHPFAKVWCPECGHVLREEGHGKPIHISGYQHHIVSEVVCLKCLSRWIAARPEGTLLKNLECSNCGQGFVIETGEVMQ